MKQHATRNHLKAHRKKSGLSQKEIAKLLGYHDAGQISRHERSASIPPLGVALAYEAIFKTPVSGLFAGIHGSVREAIENRLRDLETQLHNRSARDRGANLTAQKLVWLNERRNS